MQKVFCFFCVCVVFLKKKIGDEVHTEAAVVGRRGGGGCVVAAAGGPEVGRQRRDGHTMETLAANRASRLRWLKTGPRGNPLLGPYRIGQILFFITYASLPLLPFSRPRGVGWIQTALKPQMKRENINIQRSKLGCSQK